jgi:hypothetical protein
MTLKQVGVDGFKARVVFWVGVAARVGVDGFEARVGMQAMVTRVAVRVVFRVAGVAAGTWLMGLKQGLGCKQGSQLGWQQGSSSRVLLFWIGVQARVAGVAARVMFRVGVAARDRVDGFNSRVRVLSRVVFRVAGVAAGTGLMGSKQGSGCKQGLQ